MKYEVVLTEQAERSLHAAYRWYDSRSAEAAGRWYDGIVRAMTSLEQSPERCPLARENDRFPVELRQLNYGSGKRLTHRILFVIRPSRVVVYAVRHVAQRDALPEDL